MIAAMPSDRLAAGPVLRSWAIGMGLLKRALRDRHALHADMESLALFIIVNMQARARGSPHRRASPWRRPFSP